MCDPVAAPRGDDTAYVMGGIRVQGSRDGWSTRAGCERGQSSGDRRGGLAGFLAEAVANGIPSVVQAVYDYKLAGYDTSIRVYECTRQRKRKEEGDGIVAWGYV